MRIVIPMAGRGSRFHGTGAERPKPLIPVAGQPMLSWALKSILNVPHSEMIFVALRAHDTEYGLTTLLKDIVGANVTVILLDDVTEGQLCTVLAARDQIDVDEDILVASSDTYVVSDLAHDIQCKSLECKGIISVAQMPGDRWSFARADESSRVVEVAEKVRISPWASTGLYYFSNGHEFVEVADAIVRNGEKTRGEYYVIPVYQKYIEQRLQVTLSHASAVWDMGTPEALQEFERYLTTGSMGQPS